MITLTDDLLAIPVSKNNFHKFDLILQNNKLDKYIQHLGLPPPHPSVWQICECESRDHLSDIVKDKDFKERIDAAEHFGFHAGSCSFSADLKTKIFIPTSNDRVHAMGVFKVGPQPDKAAFHDLVEELAERILELPAAKKNILKKTLWFQNEQIREDLHELGLPPPEDVVVLMIEAETIENVVEFIHDAEVISLVKDTLSHVPSLLECTCFCADIVAKINKDEA
ncbi:hypothetical protein MVEN_00460700 [Mycena venus]|uniref:Uncharacterized protein n=1 Tax=Mycena venus TaxID=2733690 RepID=A0A8H7DAR4_9AGAR|nr:hypothetical protein MVEN_00460700 [Mycena venus]